MSMNRIQRAINTSARLHVMIEQIRATGDSESGEMRKKLDESLQEISKAVTAKLNEDVESVRKSTQELRQ